MLGLRFTKYQQIHPDMAPARWQMFTSLFTSLLGPFSTFNIGRYRSVLSLHLNTGLLQKVFPCVFFSPNLVFIVNKINVRSYVSPSTHSAAAGGAARAFPLER